MSNEIHLLVLSNLDHNFAHRLITFEVFVGIHDIFPVEYFINKDLQFTIMFDKVISNRMLINGIA